MLSSTVIAGATFFVCFPILCYLARWFIQKCLDCKHKVVKKEEHGDTKSEENGATETESAALQGLFRRTDELEEKDDSDNGSSVYYEAEDDEADDNSDGGCSSTSSRKKRKRRERTPSIKPTQSTQSLVNCESCFCCIARKIISFLFPTDWLEDNEVANLYPASEDSSAAPSVTTSNMKKLQAKRRLTHNSSP